MKFSLALLQERASVSGSHLVVLTNDGKLPSSLRGNRGKELWLCVPAFVDKKLISIAAAHFDKVYVFYNQEDK